MFFLNFNVSDEGMKSKHNAKLCNPISWYVAWNFSKFIETRVIKSSKMIIHVKQFKMKQFKFYNFYNLKLGLPWADDNQSEVLSTHVLMLNLFNSAEGVHYAGRI